jgi:phenylpropionate dioxygenase-like ring-hydroxylating dioxygenase large terminal subunit
MRSLLGPEHYLSADIFDREQQCIFRRLWIFAGFKTLLTGSDAFLTHSIGGRPIVIQNGRGKLRAFINRCAHRQGAIQLADHGQRRLACPYHGWVYNDEGRVKSIPGCEAIYGFSPEQIGELGLTPVALECVGNLVFVNLDSKPMPLDAQFHEAFLRRLEHVSSYIDDEALFAQFRAAYNWKLNFENVVDWNHVQYVHSKSFAPLMPASRPGASKPPPSPPPAPDSEIGDDLRDLSYEAQAPFTHRHWPWHDWVDRFVEDDLYFNFFLYPNVNFISIAGVTFLAQQFNPVAPNATDVRLTMTTARKRQRIPALPAILWSHMKSEKHVIDEDIAVLEGLQRGLTESGEHAMQGSYEYRLRSMAKTYRRLLRETAA